MTGPGGDSTGTRYKLYGRRGAGSLAIQILLEEIRAQYDIVWFGKSPGEIEELGRVNPAAKIPVLVLPDGTVMCESAAMVIHLASARPEFARAPASGSSAHARFLQWVVFLSANVYEALLRYFYAARYSTGGESAAAHVKEQALADWKRHFAIVHSALSPYVLGSKVSAADFYLHMLASWFPPDEAALAKEFPKFRRHAELMRALPSVQRAEADHEET